MRIELLCPACGACGFNFDDYESVVLLAPNLALMQFRCPRCKIQLSATVKLNSEMQHALQNKLNKPAGEAPKDAAAQKVACTAHHPEKISFASSLIVGSDDFQYGIVRPMQSCGAELKEELDHFKQALDNIDTVDEAIREIDTNLYNP